MMKLIWITDAQIVKDYTLRLTFNDGCRKLYDFTPLLDGSNPVFLPLKDRAVFSNLKLDGWTVTWMNGTVDIAPEFLYEEGTVIQ